MPTSDFLDYEPIHRPRRSLAGDHTSPEQTSEINPRPRQPIVSADFGVPTEKGRKRIAPAPTIGSDWAILKRGHTLTFVGLFLFTFLVYFRPYELFPSLMWLSKSAFWVAVVTLG